MTSAGAPTKRTDVVGTEGSPEVHFTAGDTEAQTGVREWLQALEAHPELLVRLLLSCSCPGTALGSPMATAGAEASLNNWLRASDGTGHLWA